MAQSYGHVLLWLGAVLLSSPPALLAAVNPAALDKYIDSAKRNGLLSEVELTVPAAAQAAPVPAPSQPRCATDYLEKMEGLEPYQPAAEIVRKEFGLDQMKVRISRKNVAAQSGVLTNKVAFEDALRAAMKSFREDPADEESPLALMIDRALDEKGYAVYPSPLPPEVLARAKELLSSWVNRPSTVVSMLGPQQVPERNESVQESWIFFLWMPEFSDHGHWAVVDRQGRKPTYNYGFN